MAWWEGTTDSPTSNRPFPLNQFNQLLLELRVLNQQCLLHLLPQLRVLLLQGDQRLIQGKGAAALHVAHRGEAVDAAHVRAVGIVAVGKLADITLVLLQQSHHLLLVLLTLPSHHRLHHKVGQVVLNPGQSHHLLSVPGAVHFPGVEHSGSVHLVPGGGRVGQGGMEHSVQIIAPVVGGRGHHPVLHTQESAGELTLAILQVEAIHAAGARPIVTALGAVVDLGLVGGVTLTLRVGLDQP
mmetsp:Transcript_17195/g.37884  ORF Transcript_17195/g.37884 Transcript_17195/m.37884 type:complete len:240 (-) Transcript_17195:737-1456(-)